MSAWLLRAWFKFQFAIPLPKTSGNSSTHAYRLYIINDPLLASPRSAKLWIVARFLRKTLFKKLFYFSKLPSIRITHQPHATLSAYSDLFRSSTTISRASHCSKNFEGNTNIFKISGTPRKTVPAIFSLACLARLAGFEPTTPWFVAKYSNPTELQPPKNGTIPENSGKLQPILINSLNTITPWFWSDRLAQIGALKTGLLTSCLRLNPLIFTGKCY